MAVVLLRARRRNQKLEFHSDRLLASISPSFQALADPEDRRRRFEAQIEERKRGDEEAMAEVDEDYVRALGYGLPPTAGEGIGIDRLTMILTGAKSIRDVILFPLLRPQGKSAAE